MHASRLWAAASLTAAALALGSPAASYAAGDPAPVSPAHVATLQHTPGGFPAPDGRDHDRRHHGGRHGRHHRRRHHRCGRRVRISRAIWARLRFRSWRPRAEICLRRDGLRRYDRYDRNNRFRRFRHVLVLDARHPKGRIDGLHASIHRFYGHRPALMVRLGGRHDGQYGRSRQYGRNRQYR